jgi:hypothetical protein
MRQQREVFPMSVNGLTILLLAAVYCCASAGYAQAAVYQWEDSSGGVHFTDSPDQIPAKYRKQVREREVHDRGESQAVAAPQDQADKVQQTDSASGSDEAKRELQWRDRFSQPRREIKALKNGLPAKRDRLVELNRQRTLFQRGSDRVEYNRLEAEISDDERRIAELETQLSNLDLEASREAVPLEWRR